MLGTTDPHALSVARKTGTFGLECEAFMGLSNLAGMLERTLLNAVQRNKTIRITIV
jgi:hypothetical protein